MTATKLHKKVILVGDGAVGFILRFRTCKPRYRSTRYHRNSTII